MMQERPSPSRREFLVASSAFTLALTIAPEAFSQGAEAAGPAINVWVSIARDGTISVVSPAAELGQGSFTSIPLILAEELDADWSKVVPVHPKSWDPKLYGNPAYGGNLNTSSSFTVRGYFTPMRLAGAQARRVLLDAAAEKWNVPAGELTTEPSVVVHAATGRRLSYGEIASFAKVPAELPKIEPAGLKPMSAFRLIGKDVDRVDVHLKTDGSAKYAMDVQVPGMVYAAVLQSPYDDGALLSSARESVLTMPGVLDVIVVPNPAFVAVIGTTVEQTQAAKQRLALKWSDTPRSHYDSEKAMDAFAAAARDKSKAGVASVNVGDAKAGLTGAKRVVSGEYRTDYVYHAQMEPLSATASVAADGKSVEIWGGTQAITNVLREIPPLLGIAPENVVFHQHYLGGAFGRRSKQDITIQAVLLSKAAGKPVKVVWTREDDMMFGMFRPMSAHYFEAGLDADGKLVAWHHRHATESVAAYMFGIRGGAAAPAQDVPTVKGTQIPQYTIPNKLAEHVVQDRNVRLSTLRGVGNSVNGFTVESFMDEVAKAAGKDPLALRLELAEGNSRAQTLLRTIAEMSDWNRKRAGRRLGISLADKDGSLSACVAEASVNRETGLVKVHHLWLAIDCGIAVQPRNLAAQMEGSAIFVLGALLRERITLKDGQVQQSNFDSYQVARMSDLPQIDVKVISTDNPPTGAGEHSPPVVTGAVGNAIAALTGVRLRQLPFSPDYVKSALSA